MQHIIFEESDKYPVAILIKPSYLRQYEIERHYIDRISHAIPVRDVVALDLAYTQAGKAPVKLIKEYLLELMPVLDSLGTKYLYCADAAYFKALTKQNKAEPHIGYVLPCKVEGFEHMQVVMGVNYGQLVYNPDMLERLDMTLHALTTAYEGNYQELGQNIIHGAEYPFMAGDIARHLNQLHKYEWLSADIEAFDLHPHKAGLGTIGFAWDKHHGIAFPVDYRPLDEPVDGFHGEFRPNRNVRALVRKFFEEYQGRLRWHNATYDIRTLIATLWMEHTLDWQGMVQGLEVMCRLFDDTKIITYLAINSTADYKLGLKDLAHEFAGNYAQDEIKDIRRIPLSDLLQYNVVDCLATNFVFDKYSPQMVRDNQLDIYRNLMLPSIKTIVQMELVGMPLEPDQVQVAKAELKEEEDEYLAVFDGNPIIREFERLQTDKAWKKDYEDRKAKAKNPDKILPKARDKFPNQPFNPNSGPQLQALLYEQLGLPVLDYTDSKQPATGGDTLKKLKNHTNDESIKAILDALIGLIGVSKILTAFIPKFEEALVKADGRAYLHGSFNLGGTVSGRLSSSKPNLQQIPSGSKYGKAIKKCFQAPKGWIMCGADFNSLEDYISALTTKDPNKLKVYEGHNIYEVTINNVAHQIRDDATVVFEGKSYTGEQFYDLYTSGSLV